MGSQQYLLGLHVGLGSCLRVLGCSQHSEQDRSEMACRRRWHLQERRASAREEIQCWPKGDLLVSHSFGCVDFGIGSIATVPVRIADVRQDLRGVEWNGLAPSAGLWRVAYRSCPA